MIRVIVAAVVMLGMAVLYPGIARSSDSTTFFSRYFPTDSTLQVVGREYRTSDSMPHSQFRIQRQLDNGKTKVLWQGPTEESYNARLTFLREEGQPNRSILVFQRQFGAAAEEMSVFLQTNSIVRVTNELQADYITIEKLDSNSLPFLVAHNLGYFVDVPDLYRWNGKSFVDVGKAHPDYYRPLLDSLKTEDTAQMSSYALFGYSRIARFAGDIKAEIRLLNLALAREKERGQATRFELIPIIDEELARAKHSR